MDIFEKILGNKRLAEIEEEVEAEFLREEMTALKILRFDGADKAGDNELFLIP